MPHITAVATKVPPHRIRQSEARGFALRHFGAHRRDVERLLPLFDHAGIETRYSCVSPGWYATPHSFQEKNDLYIEWSTKLAADVARACLDDAGLLPSDIDHVIYVSTTGLATPSIDARLFNVLGLRSDVVRTPVWGLGCAGGAAGLALAYRLAKADPNARIMLIAVELCGLTFLHDDHSKANLVATALFGDGAAGVLVTGDGAQANRNTVTPAILGAQSTTWPDSLDVMGWNFDTVGMQVVFSRAIPAIVRERVRVNVDAFLAPFGHSITDLDHVIAHPGGAKVIAAYEDTLCLQNGTMKHARAVLRDFGNMSSPTVLFVLKRLLISESAKPGDHALLTALGPGFSSENILLEF
jgi:alkylresorcinol/alkylpyrone synthase